MKTSLAKVQSHLKSASSLTLPNTTANCRNFPTNGYRVGPFPQGEFVRANSKGRFPLSGIFLCLVISRVELIRKFRLLENGLKKAGTDPTFSRRFFSLPNHIAKIYYSREQIDLVANGLKNYLSL